MRPWGAIDRDMAGGQVLHSSRYARHAFKIWVGALTFLRDSTRHEATDNT
jgi:hypothetical protein